MALMPLGNAREIAAAYRELRRRITDGAVRMFRNVGWPGGNDDFTIHWQPRYKFWALLVPQPSLYWCGCGLQNPTVTRPLQFTVQINPPQRPDNRRTGGAFLRDSHGHIYLAHNGVLTQGHASLGKEGFIAQYDDDLEPVEWPDGYGSPFAIIGRLDERRLLAKIAQFVRSVELFKASDGDSGGPGERDLNRILFTPEFAGH